MREGHGEHRGRTGDADHCFERRPRYKNAPTIASAASYGKSIVSSKNR